ncbi:MAG: hypothetical protein K0S34_1166 [Bacillales bacterium]|jgi:hypothetical protein|nr:hypothetical protein [Bacillales bacterium]
MEPSFEQEIVRFINQVESLDESFRLTVPYMEILRKDYSKKFNKFLNEKCIKNEERNIFTIPPEHSREHKKLKKRLENSKSSSTLLPRSYIVSLISLYDAYLGKLIKTMFLTVPEKLNSSQKNIEFGTLFSFSTMDEAKNYLIEKEVETVLRTSHVEQFNWLEKQLSIPLTKDLESWGNFVEVTERRNLFVHTDGFISSQYFNTCSKYQIKLDEEDISIGKQLHVTPKYFRESYNCLFEIGVKLGQVMWRKLKPNELDKADKNIHEICFNLISEEHYSIAIELLEFFLFIQKKHSSIEVTYRETLNLAQAYKWSGQFERSQKLLNKTNWSVLSYNFRLGYEVLMENYDEAATIMRRIDVEDISQNEYRSWPIFKEFRKNGNFLKVYKEKFGEEYEEQDDINNKVQSVAKFEMEAVVR